MRRRLMAGLGILVALFAMAVPATAVAHDNARAASVYTITNVAAGNAVAAYARAGDGSLIHAQG